MKRFLLDFLIIMLFAALGKSLLRQESQMSIDQRIEQFNQKVENHEVVSHTSNLHLNQTEENAAGKLGESLSHLVYETLYYTLEMIALFFDEN